MRITRRTTVFFDASVVVAGAHSTEGGSALLLEACVMGGFRAQTSYPVILEAFHALREGFPARDLARFYHYLAEVDWEVFPVPPEEKLQTYARLIDPGDLHVLAAAAEGGSEFLVTLDRKHILAAAAAVEDTNLPIRILTPGDFIQQFYPLHEDHPSLPPRRG